MLLSRIKAWLTRSIPSSTGPGKERLGLVQLKLDEPRAWVGSYPDIPTPEQPMSLQMFVARFVCGDIYAEDTPALAADLLETGYDTPSLRRLAGETQVHCHADAAELIDRIICEAGFPVPFPVFQARMLVTRHIARRVIAGQLDPWRGVSDVKETWGWRDDMPHSDVKLILTAWDEYTWDQEAQRYRPVVFDDLLDAFACVARFTDEQCTVLPSLAEPASPS
jgi:hypothetical protein